MRRLRGLSAAACVLLAACGSPAGAAPPVEQTPPSLPAAPVPPVTSRVAATPTSMPPAASTVAPAPRARPPLQQALGSVLAQHPGTIGVVVKDLATGQAVSFQSERRFRS